MREHMKTVCSDPNWISPLKNISKEQRILNGKKRTGQIFTNYTKEQLIDVAKNSKSRVEMAEKLGCTAANISYLTKLFNIRDEISKIVDVKPTKEMLLNIAKECNLKKEIAEKLNYSFPVIISLCEEYGIENEIKNILKNNRKLKDTTKSS